MTARRRLEPPPPRPLPRERRRGCREGWGAPAQSDPRAVSRAHAGLPAGLQCALSALAASAWRAQRRRQGRGASPGGWGGEGPQGAGSAAEAELQTCGVHLTLPLSPRSNRKSELRGRVLCEAVSAALGCRVPRCLSHALLVLWNMCLSLSLSQDRCPSVPTHGQGASSGSPWGLFSLRICQPSFFVACCILPIWTHRLASLSLKNLCPPSFPLLVFSLRKASGSAGLGDQSFEPAQGQSALPGGDGWDGCGCSGEPVFCFCNQNKTTGTLPLILFLLPS